MSKRAVILLPKLAVQNANVISSPLSWGFPAPSAFTGLGYALQRWLQAQGHQITVDGVGVACHRFEAQTSDTYVKALKLTRNPVDSAGSSSAIVEEGRCHMTISLIVQLRGDLPAMDEDLRAESGLAAQIAHWIGGVRIAGGSVVQPPERVFSALVISDEQALKISRAISRQLLPGRVLVARNSVLARHLLHMRQSQASASSFDALLDLLAVHHLPQATGKLNKKDEPEADWRSERRLRGWLVPVPMGYQAISPLQAPGSVRNARDISVPFRFVENLLGLGEWLQPTRVKHFEHLLWRHAAQPELGHYLLQNDCPDIQPTISN